MLEEILKILTVYLLTMVKFIAGPTLGYASGFSLFVTIAITVAGTMTSVLLFTFLGQLLREKVLKRIFRKRRVFTPRNRRFVKIWNKYGLIGVTCLTPIIFTPIGGTVLLTSFGSPKKKIISWMFVWAVVWAVIFSSAIYLFGPKILPGYSTP
ncbi:hypothetical protein E1176_14050 [Fulvivirga sp. RKSG066]|uniref:hypothetical protein n=1 Tax=Fulvivirga aurantia TaxID=2529383 RepID=UPI0012BC101A|nr:hypothetical protein [Fulvivirga aurantia]MTI22149.1 hypothetical protein [Fulvivirga aurantia]